MLPKKIKDVIILDDHPVVLTGLCELLKNSSEYRVVATGGYANDIVSLSEKFSPDIIIIDLNMPGNVKTCISNFVQNNKTTKIIVYSSSESLEDCINILQSGAHGYVLKNSSISELLHAMSAVLQNKEYISIKLASRVVQKLRSGAPKVSDKTSISFTSREEKIIEILKDGCTNKEIANKLQISESAVKFHMSQIMQKLSAKNRLEAVLLLSKKK